MPFRDRIRSVPPCGYATLYILLTIFISVPVLWGQYGVLLRPDVPISMLGRVCAFVLILMAAFPSMWLWSVWDQVPRVCTCTSRGLVRPALAILGAVSFFHYLISMTVALELYFQHRPFFEVWTWWMVATYVHMIHLSVSTMVIGLTTSWPTSPSTPPTALPDASSRVGYERA